MFYLILGVVFFGLTHPIGAILLKNNNQTLIFSFLYIFYRFIWQLPFFFAFIRDFHPNKKLISLFVFLGLIGTFLHWIEFSSLKVQIPLSHITFITFSFPLWIFCYDLITKAEKFEIFNLFKIILGLLGLFLIIWPEYTHLKFQFGYIFPLGASLLLGMWISVSANIKKMNVNPFLLSFFYDFFSMIGILIIILFQYIFKKNDFHLLTYLTSNLKTLNLGFGLFFYSLIVGVVPNILIFFGLKEVTPTKASLIMLFEPVISSFISIILFKDSVYFGFIAGATLILLINFPEKFIKEIILKKRNRYELSTKTSK